MAEFCRECGHPPIQHIQDGTTFTCIICELLARENPAMRPYICHKQMNFKLSQREREQAAVGSKDDYPPKVICGACLYSWEQHMGHLCPTGDSTFIVFIDAGAD